MRTLSMGLAAAALLLVGCEQQSEPERPVTAPGGEVAPLDVEPATDPAEENLNLYRPGEGEPRDAAEPQGEATGSPEEVETTAEPVRPDNVAPDATAEDGGKVTGQQGNIPPAE